MTQLEFQFENSIFPQAFEGRARLLFGDPWPNGGPEYDYYIKKNHYFTSPDKEYGVWRRTYATVEVDWDYIVHASKDEADELVKVGYARYW